MLDSLGKIAFWPFIRFKKRQPIIREKIKSILIIKTAYIGDVVMTLPILEPLSKQFPKAAISFLTSRGAHEILENNPQVNEVLIYNPFWFYPGKLVDYLKFILHLRKKKYDLVIEARGDIREILLLVWPLKAKYKVSYDIGGGGYLLSHVVPYCGVCHRVDYHLDIVKYLGAPPHELSWNINLRDVEKKNVDKILKDRDISPPFVAIHPGSRLTLKMWPGDKYAQLADILIVKHGMDVVFFGSSGEVRLIEAIINKMENNPVTLAGNISLREMAGLFSRSALCICNDSAPMHIAAAVKAPTVAIFGPSKSIETGPYGNKSVVVEKRYSCRSSCDESHCRHAIYNACMNDVEIEDVLDAASQLLFPNTRC